MITINNCDVSIMNSGKISYITIRDPDFDTMNRLRRGKPLHHTTMIKCEYNYAGITFYLHK